VVYAGVDYEKILREAEKEAEIIVWDGGNNDVPFYKPDLHIVVADPHRAGHEISYYPSEANVQMANVVIINKVDTAEPENVSIVKRNLRRVNPNALIIEAASPITADNPNLITGKRVLVIEDGPTLTHGNMPYGAATIIAKHFGAREIVDPRPYAVGTVKETYEKYPHLGAVLPAIGYGEKQVAELKETITRTPCDVVVIGTPVDLRRLMTIDKPTVRVKYELKVLGALSLEQILDDFLQRRIENE
jgi:predicted GTPase